jgi:hypothetical protein
MYWKAGCSFWVAEGIRYTVRDPVIFVRIRTITGILLSSRNRDLPVNYRYVMLTELFHIC